MSNSDSKGQPLPEDEFSDLQRFAAELAYNSEEKDSRMESIPGEETRKESKDLRGELPISAMDVAEYILRRIGPMSTMKLQKLVYYCQAWSLVWDEKPLFHEDVEAWANGPVIRGLFNYHRGMFDIQHVLTGNPDNLSVSQKETIEAVLDFYGDKTAQWLIELSHSEKPWREARRGLSESASSSRVISLDSMANYYSSLLDE